MVVPEHRTGGLAAATAAVVLVVGHGRAARVVRSGRPAPATATALGRMVVTAVVVVVAFAVVVVVVVIVITITATAATAIVIVVVFIVVTVTVPSVNAVVVVVVVVMMTVAVVIVVLVVPADDRVGGCLAPARRVVLNGSGHQGRGGPVTIESGLQELVGGQEVVAGVHQTGRVQRRTERRRLRLVVRRLLLLVVW